ncbi:MAG: hypothetical protein WC637_03960 [Victivallales bacterium]|jgi:hypothetical protein
MKKAWMVIIIVASLLAFAGAGFIIYRNVAPGAGADKKLLLNEEKSLAQDSPGKKPPRKSKPLRQVHKKTINMRNQPSASSPSNLLEEFLSTDEAGRIRLIATLYTFEPSLLRLALDDKSKDVRVATVKFISFVPETQIDISPFLSKALDDDSADVRREAHNVIDSITDDNTMLRIIGSSLNSRYADTRLKCVSEFTYLGVSREDLKNLMLKALADDDTNVRNAAIATASSLWGKEFKSGQEAVEYLSKH